MYRWYLFYFPTILIVASYGFIVFLSSTGNHVTKYDYGDCDRWTGHLTFRALTTWDCWFVRAGKLEVPWESNGTTCKTENSCRLSPQVWSHRTRVTRRTSPLLAKCEPMETLPVIHTGQDLMKYSLLPQGLPLCHGTRETSLVVEP
jgi:hypothetical protein